MQHEMLDPKAAAHYATFTARSNPAATVEYLTEDLAADDRPGLKNVSVPLLEIMPYDAADAKRIAAYTKQPVTTEAAKTAYYRKLFKNAPHAKVIAVAPSRHFVMLDQPQRFEQRVDTFLAKLGSKK